MRYLFLALIGVLMSVNSNSQHFEYRKDDRPQNIKEDKYNSYQAEEISKATLLKALEAAGIRIFNFPISPAFEKEYDLFVNLNEYEDNELVKSTDIAYTYRGKNMYVHYVKDSVEDKEIPFVDYIPQLTFYTKDNDSTLSLTLEMYGGSLRTLLKKKIRRNGQFYNWRIYGKTEWTLNEEIPLLVYASSWYDERIESDRFCGTVDLSQNEEETKELLGSSPHYFVVSLKISE